MFMRSLLAFSFVLALNGCASSGRRLLTAEESKAVIPPTLLSIPAPEYPEDARQLGIEGTVTVKAIVNRDGRVTEAFVAESNPALNSAAIRAVRAATFKPATFRGSAVAVWVQVPVVFRLRDSGDERQ